MPIERCAPIPDNILRNIPAYRDYRARLVVCRQDVVRAAQNRDWHLRKLLNGLEFFVYNRTDLATLLVEKAAQLLQKDAAGEFLIDERIHEFRFNPANQLAGEVDSWQADLLSAESTGKDWFRTRPSLPRTALEILLTGKGVDQTLKSGEYLLGFPINFNDEKVMASLVFCDEVAGKKSPFTPEDRLLARTFIETARNFLFWSHQLASIGVTLRQH